MNELKKKKKIVEYSKLFSTKKLSPIRSGNISIRHNMKNTQGFLISPSGKKNSELKIEDIVFVSLEGKAHNNKIPSSEWPFHLEIYTKYAVNAVVHAHSKFAVICSCLYKKIPSFHYMIAVAETTEIKVAKYALFGTKELSKNVSIALKNSKTCLISNHGQVSIGSNIDRAFELAEEVELLCEYYYYCRLYKKPKILSELKMKKVLKKISNYKSN